MRGRSYCRDKGVRLASGKPRKNSGAKSAPFGHAMVPEQPAEQGELRVQIGYIRTRSLPRWDSALCPLHQVRGHG